MKDDITSHNRDKHKPICYNDTRVNKIKDDEPSVFKQVTDSGRLITLCAFVPKPSGPDGESKVTFSFKPRRWSSQEGPAPGVKVVNTLLWGH